MIISTLSKTMAVTGLVLFSSLSYAVEVERVYKLPQTIIQQLKTETEHYQRGDCDRSKLEFDSSEFYSLADDKLLIFIGLPDYFCFSRSFLPVTLDMDSSRNWKSGTVLESTPSMLQADNKQFWLVSHFEVEAVFPLLHYSADAINWQEINLPKPAGIDCCFVWIKQICVTDTQVEVKFSGIDDQPVEYWHTGLSDSLSANPKWEKLTPEAIKNPSQCRSAALTAGDWQHHIAPNQHEVWLQSAAKHIKVILPRWLN